MVTSALCQPLELGAVSGLHDMVGATQLRTLSTNFGHRAEFVASEEAKSMSPVSLEVCFFSNQP
jgi:hypothetical protein